jgi:hypothetical protein
MPLVAYMHACLRSSPHIQHYLLPPAAVLHAGRMLNREAKNNSKDSNAVDIDSTDGGMGAHSAGAGEAMSSCAGSKESKRSALCGALVELVEPH